MRSSGTLVSIDRSAGQWGQDNATTWSTDAIQFVTDLGGTWFVLALGVVVCVVEYLRVPNRWIPFFLLTVLVGEVVLVNAVKQLLDRVRPTFNPIAETLGPSFPSGHSATAAALYAAVALVLARRRSPRSRCAAGRRSGRRRDRRGRESRAARCPLAVRRRGRPRLRLGLVRALRDRIRRTVPDLRAAREEGGACRRACRGRVGAEPLRGLRSKSRLCIGPSTRRRRRETPGSMTSRCVRGSLFSTPPELLFGDRSPPARRRARSGRQPTSSGVASRCSAHRRSRVSRASAGSRGKEVHLGVVEQRVGIQVGRADREPACRRRCRSSRGRRRRLRSFPARA